MSHRTSPPKKKVEYSTLFAQCYVILSFNRRLTSNNNNLINSVIASSVCGCFNLENMMSRGRWAEIQLRCEPCIAEVQPLKLREGADGRWFLPVKSQGWPYNTSIKQERQKQNKSNKRPRKEQTMNNSNGQQQQQPEKNHPSWKSNCWAAWAEARQEDWSCSI